MVEREEISAEELCPARRRAVMLQKRFQELITNVIKDTQNTFSSLMEDLDESKESVKKFPSLPQITNRFHCQMARNSWNLPKPGEGSANAGNGPGSCFDAPSTSSSDTGESCSQDCGSFDAASLSLENMQRDEYEASERLKSLIESELHCRRKEIVRDRNYILYHKRTSSYLGDLRKEYPSYPQRGPHTTHSNFETIELEYPTDSQRMDSLIRDELNRKKVHVDVSKEELNPMNVSVDVPKDDDKPCQSRLRMYSPTNFSRR